MPRADRAAAAEPVATTHAAAAVGAAADGGGGGDAGGDGCRGLSVSRGAAGAGCGCDGANETLRGVWLPLRSLAGDATRGADGASDPAACKMRNVERNLRVVSESSFSKAEAESRGGARGWGCGGRVG